MVIVTYVFLMIIMRLCISFLYKPGRYKTCSLAEISLKLLKTILLFSILIAHLDLELSITTVDNHYLAQYWTWVLLRQAHEQVFIIDQVWEQKEESSSRSFSEVLVLTPIHIMVLSRAYLFLSYLIRFPKTISFVFSISSRPSICNRLHFPCAAMHYVYSMPFILTIPDALLYHMLTTPNMPILYSYHVSFTI